MRFGIVGGAGAVLLLSCTRTPALLPSELGYLKLGEPFNEALSGALKDPARTTNTGLSMEVVLTPTRGEPIDLQSDLPSDEARATVAAKKLISDAVDKARLQLPVGESVTREKSVLELERKAPIAEVTLEFEGGALSVVSFPLNGEVERAVAQLTDKFGVHPKSREATGPGEAADYDWLLCTQGADYQIIKTRFMDNSTAVRIEISALPEEAKSAKCSGSPKL